jgi:hypothetical protein
MKTIYKILILLVIVCPFNYRLLFSSSRILNPLDNENVVSNSSKIIQNSGTFYLPDYTIVYQNQNNIWGNYNKINYIYDSGYTLSEDNKSIWQNNDWAYYERNMYLNGPNSKLSEQVYQRMLDNKWLNARRWLFDYNSNDKLSLQTEQRWDTSWVNVFKDTLNYDNIGYNYLWFRQKWNFDKWVDMAIDSAIFNEKNQQIEDYLLNWLGIQWVNEEKNTYEYDASGNILFYTNYVWMPDSTWLMNVRYIYSYDVNGNQIEFIRESRQNDTMIADIKFLDKYDGIGNRIERLRQSWDGEKWLDALKYEYFYKQITSIQENKDIFNIKISPNPISDDSKIEFELANPSYIGIKIYNELGKEIYQIANAEYPAGRISVNLNGYDLQSGMYFLRIQIGGDYRIFPIVKF